MEEEDFPLWTIAFAGAGTGYYLNAKYGWGPFGRESYVNPIAATVLGFMAGGILAAPLLAMILLE